MIENTVTAQNTVREELRMDQVFRAVRYKLPFTVTFN